MNRKVNSEHKLPSLATWLLKRFCSQEYWEEVSGDVNEVFQWRVQEKGPIRAKMRSYLDVLSAIRLLKIESKSDKSLSRSMLYSFVKTSFRNFSRNWSYTFLNIFGLALGMAAALFILEYVSDELNYNKPTEADQIYRVSNDYYRFKKMVYESSMTFSGVGPAMERDLPDVTEFARLYSANTGWGGAMILTRPDNPNIKFKEHKLFFADPAIIDLFDIPIISGMNTLGELNTILLAEEMAVKYFGSPDAAIGQTLRYNDNLTEYELRVTGIFKRPDYNLQVDVDILISYKTRSQSDPERFANDWGGNSFITFIKLIDGADPRAIERAMNDLTLRYKPGYTEKNEHGEYDRINRYFLTNIQDIHLNSKYQNEVGPVGSSTTINLLQVIALFIVVIAWINFINLTTAKSIDRAREVGVRKVMGARKNELVVQFFTEAFLINLLALIIALAMVMLGQSTFNQFTEKMLSIDSIHFGQFVVPGIGIFFLGTILSGLYPALILSSHQTVMALKGKSNNKSGIGLRRGLIVFQLLFSSLLIIATMTINRQLNFMNSQDMGFNMEQVLIVRGPAIRDATDGAHLPAIRTFKQRILDISNVKNIGTSTIIPGMGILRGIVLMKDKSEDFKSIERVVTDNSFLETMGVRFVAGRDFDPNMVGTPPIILNRAAVLELGFQSPEEALGKTIFEFAREERLVVGVIEDYHHESLNRPIDPMYFVRNEAFDTFYAIRLSSSEITDQVDQIERVYSEMFPGNPMESYFLDQYFGNQYKRDEVNSRVFGAFSLMAVIVACLGLYGLSSFSAVQRTKELGVRKVLGAKVKSIFLLLSKEVLILALIGFALATPLAYYGVNRWLEGFAFHIDIEPILFVIPFVLVILVTLLAVSQKIIKTARVNPVKSLRYE